VRESLSECVQNVFGVSNVVEGREAGVKTKSSGAGIESQRASDGVGETLSVSLRVVGQSEEFLEKFQ
jgi:hypothetical protein